MVQTTLKVDGMMCGMCESHVNDAIRKAFAVKKVSSSHKKGETVILMETAPSEEEFHRIIDATGYQLLDIKSEPYEKKGLFDLFSK